ncbi:conserved hypothetical protein [Histoplasma mississippiense (nom. inval.)]|uniref:conserved hypothetical protein n=1 Tax=Ajellomyces capsulatus (strain NAm1 / WU24) TaxID=2059318 RepID=UPI000157B52B|nr:conserved hypothetical protein [Histoplasma mississippiense (nom. inval.)]EDN02585.1 conserved hypothetical protein [Histoplasma mississippiense (nom. inval.)]
MTLPRVPFSDSAGIVLSTGPRVVHFRRGDRVCTLFNQTHQSNPITRDSMSSGLRGTLDGTLCKYAVLPEPGLVMAPSNLSPIAASTLSCAHLTAWNALYGLTPLKPGDVVLTQGTVCGGGWRDGGGHDIVGGEGAAAEKDGRSARD